MKIKPPLSFQGGKQRVAKKIADIIVKEGTQYVDLCCGSGAVSLGLVNNGVHPEDILMVDSSDWGDFWLQVSSGSFDMCWFEDIITNIPKDKSLIRPHLERYAKAGYEQGDDTCPIWLMLQAGSFGGKHIYTKNGKFCNASFRSYWQPTETSKRRSPVNPMMPMPNTLLRQVKVVVDTMSPIKALHGDVLDIDWDFYENSLRTKDNVIIFIDPPYEGTTGYGFNLDYVNWYKNLRLPSNYSLWITDYRPMERSTMS